MILLPIHHEKLMEQTIQRVKIDMYKDRYKTYGNTHTSYFYAQKGEQNEEKRKD